MLRGLGYGMELIKISICFYYVIGIASMVLLCKWIEMRVLAVWMGFTIGELAIVLVFIYMFITTDIDDRTQEMHEQVKVRDEEYKVAKDEM